MVTRRCGSPALVLSATSAAAQNAIRQLGLRRFTGEAWKLFGDVISE
jgi:hypothetical protein